MLQTNPVLVRRTMAVLREAGHVRSTGGPGGGWALTCELSDLTVRDVYTALGSTALFAIAPADDNPACPVESAVNQYVIEAFNEAENTLLRLFGETRLSEIARGVTSAASGKSSLKA